MFTNGLKDSLPSVAVGPIAPKIVLAVLVTIVVLSGCTWVKTDPGAEQVRLAGAADVQDCQYLAQTTASVADRVSGVQRRAERVADELADLARNSAVDVSGDTIVPDGPVSDGRRRFRIYRCGT